MNLGLLDYRNDAPIDWVGPVNWLHPLARGLESWWLCVPGAMGGSRWIDLCRRHHGTLTSMDPATDWVGSKGRPGGWGSLDFDGSDDHVKIDSAIVTAAPLTMAAWFRSDSAAAGQTLVSIGQSVDDNNYFRLVAAGDQVGDPVRLVSSDSATERFAHTTTGYSANTWHFAVGAIDSATSRRVYIDGGSEGSDVVSATPAGLTAVSIGRLQRNTSVTYMDGCLDGVMIYSRALPAAEVRSLYDLSRRAYQGLLNRMRLGPYCTAPAAPPQHVVRRTVTITKRQSADVQINKRVRRNVAITKLVTNDVER